MPDRDSDITKFSYYTYRELKKMLGEFDAVVECNEIAIREFVEHAKKENPQKYIQQLSKKHKVKVDEVDFIKFSSRIRQYYVASVFQQSEQFLKNFKDEWKKYFNDQEWIEPLKGETKLQNILRNLSIIISSDLIDCYEYYRLVRNYMSHTDRDLNELKKRHSKIESNKNEFLTKLNLVKLPSSLDNIDFDDFLILTNIVKHIAFVLCVNSKPNNERIAEILFELSKENNGRTYKGLKKLKNDNGRYIKAIKQFAITSFGRFSSVDIEEVTRKLKSMLA